MQRLRMLPMLAASAALTFACASSPTVPAQQASGASPEMEPPTMPAASEYEARRIDLDIGPPLEGCGVVEAYFYYDEARPRPQDEQVALAQLAACLKVPPHDRSTVRLIGHADQRGPEWYNERLAEKRAGYVRDVLIEYGIAPERIEVVARGEKGAQAASDPLISHGYDRRVDAVEVRAIVPR